jgi:DNA-binding CsgD family transcriptional regulator
MGPAGQSLRWPEHAELVPHTEQLGVLGSWAYAPGTEELLWSENHFRLFALEPGAIVPCNEWVLDHIHPSDRQRVETVLYGLVDSDEPTELEYRIVRADGIVRDVRSTLAFAERDASGEKRMFGHVQDVTEQKAAARELAAHAAVSGALEEWQSLNVSAGPLLAAIGVALHLPLGVLWVPRSETLEAAEIWHAESTHLPAVVEATRSWRPGRGDPALGRAWVQRRPIAMTEPALAVASQRAAAVREAGIVAMIAFPAVAANETLAILEFLSVDPVEPSDRMLESLAGMGREIGYFLSRRRGELVDPILTPRETEILQLAARGVSAAGIAEALGVSSSTVKRHFEDSYARLDVPDRAAAVAEAMRLGLIA